ncbi:MAG: hypothetical protein ACTSU4_09605, partial [Promethearchaeota archaeon]
MRTIKKALKFSIVIFIITIFFLASITQSNNSFLTNVYDTTSNNNPNEILNENIDAPSIKESSGNTLINETVSGTGDNQTVRTYFINQS